MGQFGHDESPAESARDNCCRVMESAGPASELGKGCGRCGVRSTQRRRIVVQSGEGSSSPPTAH